MDNFKAVYKILSALEKAMDYPEFSMMKKVYNAVKGIKDITPGL